MPSELKSYSSLDNLSSVYFFVKSLAETHVEAEAAQHVINVSTFNMNVAGDFVVVITNQNYEANDTQTSDASDTMFVIDVDWTGYSE